MAEQEVRNMAAVLQEPDGDHDRLPRALRRVAFFFMFLITSSFVDLVVNSSSSIAVEDVLTLFLFWTLCLVIFFASFVLRAPPEAERLAARVADALSRFLLADGNLLLF